MKENNICQNCSWFIQYGDDLYTDQGICVKDPLFEPFVDEILLDDNLTNCYELYKQKRFSGDNEACDDYEEPELLLCEEGEDLKAHLIVQQMKYQNVDEINEYLHSDVYENVEKAISVASTYIRIGNQDAYEYLLNYYLELGPATTLNDTHLRIKIIDALYTTESEQRTIEAYVNELSRTQSNNTTRKLYTLILKRLKRCNIEITKPLLLQLIKENKHSYKMKNRILDIIYDF